MHRHYPGHCYCCEQRCYNPQDKTANWHGTRTTMLLANGSQTSVTLCDRCLEEPDLNKIWKNMIAGWVYEHATKIVVTPKDAVAKKQMHCYISRQMRESFILCILYSMPCCDVADWI